MKKLLFGTLLMISVNAFAQTTATFTAASNYIWRGLTFSGAGALEAAQGQSVIQGSFDYAHSSGLGLSLFVGPSDTTVLVNGDSANGGTVQKDNEFDPTISYTYAIAEDFKVIGAVTRYSYVRNSSNNATDLQLAIAWRSFRLDGSYMDKYFGTASSDTYVRLSVREPLVDKLGFIASYGSSSFGKEEKVGFKNYADWRAGLSYTMGSTVVEAAYTDTNRKDLSDIEQKDEAVTFSAAMTFQ